MRIEVSLDNVKKNRDALQRTTVWIMGNSPLLWATRQALRFG